MEAKDPDDYDYTLTSKDGDKIGLTQEAVEYITALIGLTTNRWDEQFNGCPIIDTLYDELCSLLPEDTQKRRWYLNDVWRLRYEA
jgi:hypothetical protein